MVPLFRAHRHVRTLALLTLSLATIVVLVILNNEPTHAGPLGPGGSFIDDDLNTHEGFIEAIAALGVTSGCETDEFCPYEETSRAQMATFIAGALNLPPASTDYFGDDDKSAHEDNINRLADAGVSVGCGGPSYCPDDPVTREQMATFMAKAFNAASTTTDYFTDDETSVHESSINKIAGEGITLGCGNGHYCPEDNIPRDQMASFLGRAMGLTEIEPPYPVRTLLERFYEYDPSRSGVKRYDVDGVYRPRQFAANLDIDPDEGENYLITSSGKYDGWDVFIPEREWSNASGTEYMNITLTRPTRVAIVWVSRWDPLPSWLKSWSLSGTVGVDHRVANVYERTLGYGEHWLPGPSADGDYSRNYLVLFGESTSTATVDPPVPAGNTTPDANQLCPVWVHDDLYQVEGPDGVMYGSWHPQIDPTYWCYFGHEHGSNPDLIPGKPKVPYQYVAAKVPQNEPDIGFKETILKTSNGYWVRFIDHAATSSERRVCAQLHTVYVMVYTAGGNEVFRMGFKADFGISQSTDGGALINSTDCGYNMADLAEVTESSKKIRTSADSHDYERWKARPTVEAANLGMVFEHRFDVRDPFTFCPGTQCNDVTFHNTGETGTKRTIDVDDFIFDARLALAEGIYYTNPYGTALEPSGSPNAVQQYIQPDFYLDLGIMGEGHCVANDPWFMQYVCNNNMSVGRVNISGSLDPAAWDAQLLSTAQAAGMTLEAATLQYRCTIETTLNRSEVEPTPVHTNDAGDSMLVVLLLPATLRALPQSPSGRQTRRLPELGGERVTPHPKRRGHVPRRMNRTTRSE